MNDERSGVSQRLGPSGLGLGNPAPNPASLRPCVKTVRDCEHDRSHAKARRTRSQTPRLSATDWRLVYTQVSGFFASECASGHSSGDKHRAGSSQQRRGLCNAGLPPGQSPALLSSSSGQTGGMHTPQVFVCLASLCLEKARKAVVPGPIASGITSQVSGFRFQVSHPRPPPSSARRGSRRARGSSPGD
jgi:hypothetical protein